MGRNQRSSAHLLRKLAGALLLFLSVSLGSASLPPVRFFTAERLYQEMILEESMKQSVDPALVMAIVAQESSFRWWAVSPSGAIGLGQIMPGTAMEVCGPAIIAIIFHPRINLRCSIRYLAAIVAMCNGDKVCTLAGYNQGPWFPGANGRPVTVEAMDYVPRVLKFYAVYSLNRW